VRGRILILETDPGRRNELELELAAQGYEIACAADATLALRASRAGAHELERAASRRPVVAASPAMIELLEAIERRASSERPLLLEGEAGTGKESLARVLHAQSARRNAPFLALDSRDAEPAWARVPFAEGGTLFVEGLEAPTEAAERTLLRLLLRSAVATKRDEKPRRVDLRIVLGATRSLASPDLAGALGDAPLRVPALRERREDLPLLFDHLLARAARSLRRAIPSVDAEALARLVAHAWPGNLRELESAAVRGALRAAAGVVTLHELPEEVAHTAATPRERTLALKPARKGFEADWIRRALRAAGGNRTHAARLLEISHRALLYKLKEFGISN